MSDRGLVQPKQSLAQPDHKAVQEEAALVYQYALRCPKAPDFLSHLIDLHPWRWLSEHAGAFLHYKQASLVGQLSLIPASSNCDSRAAAIHISFASSTVVIPPSSINSFASNLSVSLLGLETSPLSIPCTLLESL